MKTLKDHEDLVLNGDTIKNVCQVQSSRGQTEQSAVVKSTDGKQPGFYELNLNSNYCKRCEIVF